MPFKDHNDWESYTPPPVPTKGKVMTYVIIVLVAAIALSIGGFYLNQWTRRVKAPTEGATAQIEATQGDADFRIQAYEWFFDQCASIQSAEDTISNQLIELETADTDRASIINTNLVAQRNRRASLIRTYNQEVRKEDTTGQFLATGLPDFINIDNNRTPCGE